MEPKNSQRKIKFENSNSKSFYSVDTHNEEM